MKKPVALKIDFVSDVACPWCAVGLSALQRALKNLDGEVAAELHFQPFELNPDMPPEGRDVVEYLMEKYRRTREQIDASQQVIRERGAAVGFTFGQRVRAWNTFDAHRLLHWAGETGDRQPALKRAVLEAYFTRGENPSDHAVLSRVAGEVGLDPAQAMAVLKSDRYADEVRAQERKYQGLGIHSVPAIIINDRHLIEGGQPVDVFEQALRQIAAESVEGIRVG